LVTQGRSWPDRPVSADPAQQVAPLAQHKALAARQEGDAVEVGALGFAHRILLPALAGVVAHQQGAAAARGPDGAAGIPGHVQVAKAVGDRDHRLAPVVQVAGIAVEAHLGTPGHHPVIAIGLEAHGLHPLAADPLVGLPDRLARLPGGKEVAQTGHAHVIAIAVAAQVAHGAGGIAHGGLPAGAAIVGLVDGAHVGGQLGTAAAQGRDQVGLAGQLGVEEQAGPALAGVGAVQQQAGLAGDPALRTPEINADQAEVFFRRQVQGPFLPGGAAIAGFQDQPVAAHQEAVGVGVEGQIEGVGPVLQGHRLPGAGAGDRQARGDAPAGA